MEKGLTLPVVVGLGQVCVDYVGQVPAYPPEDTKAELKELHMSCGGPAATAMTALSRWGVSTSLLSGISGDPFGRKISRTLEKEGVETVHLKMVPGCASQFAFITAVTFTGCCRVGKYPNAWPLHQLRRRLNAKRAVVGGVFRRWATLRRLWTFRASHL